MKDWVLVTEEKKRPVLNRHLSFNDESMYGIYFINF